ncbi:hypothetical protein [Deinococcus multiflagellatus]|uniref:Uncharacterized protein n=1 Tax=Deinococcus multiflagellatus TaxID=1656887 RepID=A0ABW1ZUE9_9DEIO
MVRLEHDQADHCRVRVWTKDDQGERHFYSVTFTGSRAGAARTAQPGMIMHLNVTARKVKLERHWTDLVEARHVHLCMSRVHRAEAQPVLEERPAPMPAPALTPADAPVRMPRPKLAPRLTTGGVGGEWLAEAAD